MNDVDCYDSSDFYFVHLHRDNDIIEEDEEERLDHGDNEYVVLSLSKMEEERRHKLSGKRPQKKKIKTSTDKPSRSISAIHFCKNYVSKLTTEFLSFLTTNL